MKDERFNELVTKFLTRDISENEKNELNIFLQLDQFNKEFEVVVNNWNGLTREQISFDSEKALQNISGRLVRSDSSEKPHISAVQHSFFSSTFIKAAAVFLIMVTIVGTGYFILNKNTAKRNQIVWNEKTTVAGQRAIINMPEGTTITLNADTKLKYPNTFTGNTREVFLEGEAFLEVSKDFHKPFIVHTGALTTTVLGTKFNIKSFSNEDEIEISLTEGKVKVSSGKGTDENGIIVLKPSQKLVFDKKEEISSIESFDTQKETGWIDNNLKYVNEPISKIFVELERAYGIKFELGEKSFANKKLTANFKNDSFFTVSEVLKRLTGLSYKTIKENNRITKITFYKKK